MDKLDQTFHLISLCLPSRWAIFAPDTFTKAVFSLTVLFPLTVLESSTCLLRSQSAPAHSRYPLRIATSISTITRFVHVQSSNGYNPYWSCLVSGTFVQLSCPLCYSNTYPPRAGINGDIYYIAHGDRQLRTCQSRLIQESHHMVQLSVTYHLWCDKYSSSRTTKYLGRVHISSSSKYLARVIRRKAQGSRSQLVLVVRQPVS